MALRMLKLKTCCEFMCGLDPPFIKYSSTANAFVSVVPVKNLSNRVEVSSSRSKNVSSVSCLTKQPFASYSSKFFISFVLESARSYQKVQMSLFI